MPSYEKNKSSGLWSVRFRETINYETHQKRLSGFKTKKEAQYGYEDYIKNQQGNNNPVNSDLSFSELTVFLTRDLSTRQRHLRIWQSAV